MCDDDERRMKSSAVKSLWAWFVNSTYLVVLRRGVSHTHRPLSPYKNPPSSCSTPPLVVGNWTAVKNSLLVFFFFSFPYFRFKKGEEEEEAAHDQQQQQQQKRDPERKRKGTHKRHRSSCRSFFYTGVMLVMWRKPRPVLTFSSNNIHHQPHTHISAAAAAGRPIQRQYVTRRLTAHTHNQGRLRYSIFLYLVVVVFEVKRSSRLLGRGRGPAARTDLSTRWAFHSFYIRCVCVQCCLFVIAAHRESSSCFFSFIS